MNIEQPEGLNKRTRAMGSQRLGCAFCPGPVRRVVEGGIGEHVQWKVCEHCGAKSGPWPEHQWCEPSSEPDLFHRNQEINPPGTESATGMFDATSRSIAPREFVRPIKCRDRSHDALHYLEGEA